MRVGVNLPQYSIDFAKPETAVGRLIRLAQRAEECGLDDVWLSDHPFALAPDGTISGALEPLVLLGALARATTRIGLGTLVLAATMRAPALVRSHVGTLPASRLTVGVGAGWYRPEHDAFGLALPPLEARAALMEQTLSFARDAGARALAGGTGDRVIRIAARAADAWNAAWDPPDDAFRARSAALDAACIRAGRDPKAVARSVGVNVLVARDDAGIETAVERIRSRAAFLAALRTDDLRSSIVCGTPDVCAGRIAAYGADEVVVTLALRDDEDMLELFAGEVAPRLR